jgi:hypothetical protein
MQSRKPGVRMRSLVHRLRDVAAFIGKEHGRVAAAACLATEAADVIERMYSMHVPYRNISISESGACAQSPQFEEPTCAEVTQRAKMLGLKEWHTAAERTTLMQLAYIDLLKSEISRLRSGKTA